MDNRTLLAPLGNFLIGSICDGDAAKCFYECENGRGAREIDLSVGKKIKKLNA